MSYEGNIQLVNGTAVETSANSLIVTSVPSLDE